MHSSQQRCQLDAITRFLLGSCFPASLPGQARRDHSPSALEIAALTM